MDKSAMIDPSILKTAIAVKENVKYFAEDYSKGKILPENVEERLWRISQQIKAMRKLNKKNVQSFDSERQDSSRNTV